MILLERSLRAVSIVCIAALIHVAGANVATSNLVGSGRGVAATGTLTAGVPAYPDPIVSK